MIAYRLALPVDPDRKFIIASWLDSHQYSNTAGLIAMDSWYDVMWPQIARVLDRAGTVTAIAHDADDVDVFVGFASAQPQRRTGIMLMPLAPLLHYVYVKDAFRGAGVARRLLKAVDIDARAPFDYTCSTPDSSELTKAGKLNLARWRPLRARHD